jgi:aspartate aminotransferase
MESLSNRVQAVTPSVTLAVTNQAKALVAEGEEVYGLAGGEPEMDTPGFIKDAAIKALQDGHTKYTAAAGIPELREAIAKKLADENGINVETKGICVTSGAKQACFNAILSVVEEGDEVIIFGGPQHATKFAAMGNTISYELITGISQRVKRLIIEE